MVSKNKRLMKIIFLMDQTPRITLDDIDDEFTRQFEEMRE